MRSGSARTSLEETVHGKSSEVFYSGSEHLHLRLLKCIPSLAAASC